MNVGKSHKPFRHCISLCCTVSLILFTLAWWRIPAVCAQAVSEHGSDTTPGKTSPYAKRGKEGLMADKDKLTAEEGMCLLSVARETIEQKLFNRGDQVQLDPEDSPKFSERRGTFVTRIPHRRDQD
jgi:hypothetical protein